MVWRRGEAMVARLMLRLHRPAAADRARLDAVWGAVTARAGIDPTAYSLWVEESDEINAYASAGHIVAVTRCALDTMPPPHLEAVLAPRVSPSVELDPPTRSNAADQAEPITRRTERMTNPHPVSAYCPLRCVRTSAITAWYDPSDS